jgi:hypothetical protein
MSTSTAILYYNAGLLSEFEANMRIVTNLINERLEYDN